MSKARASCFIRGSKNLKTIKALSLRPLAIICFSVFGTCDETVALVFDILHDNALGVKVVFLVGLEAYFEQSLSRILLYNSRLRGLYTKYLTLL